MLENWSYSKVNTLRQCNRKFYYSYILAHHSFKHPIRRKAYVLKKMQNLQMWKGTIIDKTMEKLIIPVIANKQPLNLSNIADEALNMARKQFAFSLNKLYNQKDITKTEAGDDFCILDIHELNLPYFDHEIEKVYKTVHKIIMNLNEVLMPDGAGTLINYLKRADMLIPNIQNWKINLNNIPVSPQIDLIAFQNWKPHVIDWKVSGSETSDYSRQLLIAGLTVFYKRIEKQKTENKKPYGFEDITLYEINLLKRQVKNHPFNCELVNDMVDYMYLTNSDILLLFEKKKFDQCSIDDIELTDNEAICRFCNFRTLCMHLLTNDNNYEERIYSESLQA